MTHVKALQAGHSSQGTSEPITPESVSPRISSYGETTLSYIIELACCIYCQFIQNNKYTFKYNFENHFHYCGTGVELQ